ncbi:hypothetical protein F5Y15DRAFT_327940 [Xylariaceae sp. FL0016]|nr:hypothetical protein F5Y15DRAFT_327940 [Xylariaceae sp. FL0016]
MQCGYYNFSSSPTLSRFVRSSQSRYSRWDFLTLRAVSVLCSLPKKKTTLCISHGIFRTVSAFVTPCFFLTVCTTVNDEPGSHATTSYWTTTCGGTPGAVPLAPFLCLECTPISARSLAGRGNEAVLTCMNSFRLLSACYVNLLFFPALLPHRPPVPDCGWGFYCISFGLECTYTIARQSLFSPAGEDG